jgi:hypothetical protein
MTILAAAVMLGLGGCSLFEGARQAERTRPYNIRTVRSVRYTSLFHISPFNIDKQNAFILSVLLEQEGERKTYFLQYNYLGARSFNAKTMVLNLGFKTVSINLQDSVRQQDAAGSGYSENKIIRLNEQNLNDILNAGQFGVQLTAESGEQTMLFMLRTRDLNRLKSNIRRLIER